MAKGKVIAELKRARTERGLTMEQAGALIVVDGKPVDKGTWHGWEAGDRVPKAAFMFEIERVFGVEPNCFYDRPAARAIATRPPMQGELAIA